MSLNDRISDVLSYSGLTPAEFADKIEVQRSSLSHIASGRNKPSLDFLIKVKEYFPELSWDWLINGEGDMLLQKEEKASTPTPPQPVPLPDLFSLLNDDQFGYPTEKDDTILTAPNPQESRADVPKAAETTLSNSQRSEKNGLEKNNKLSEEKYEEKPKSVNRKINKIVIFYEDGKFESYEPQ